jgi:hypothetical protein
VVVEAAWVSLGALTLFWEWIQPLGVGQGGALPEGSDEAGPTPKRSSEAERVPKGSGEPEILLVGSNWAVATLTIILGGLRPMSFNSCLMGTVILVPDSSPPTCRVRHSSTGFTVGWQGFCSPGGARERTRWV